MKTQEELIERLREIQRKKEFVEPKLKREYLKQSLEEYVHLIGERCKKDYLVKRQARELQELKVEVLKKMENGERDEEEGKHVLKKIEAAQKKSEDSTKSKNPKSDPNRQSRPKDPFLNLILHSCKDIEEAIESALEIGQLRGMLMYEQLHACCHSESVQKKSDLTIVEALKSHGGNVSATHRSLKINPETLRTRINDIAKRHGIHRNIVKGKPAKK